MLITERARSSIDLDDWMDFSGTITTGGTAQTLLPQQQGRTALYIFNTSSALITVYIGPPPVTTLTLTSGVITAFSVSDNGLGWVTAPQVVLMGGIIAGNWYAVPGGPNFVVGAGAFPGQVGQVQAKISAGALNGFNIINGGSNYAVAPTAKLVNPWPLGGAGAGTPSATRGIPIAAGGGILLDSTVCPQSAVNIFGGTTSQTFECKVVLT